MTLRRIGVVGLWLTVVCNLIALVKAVATLHLIKEAHTSGLMYDPEIESSIQQSALLTCSILIAVGLAGAVACLISLRRWPPTDLGTEQSRQQPPA